MGENRPRTTSCPFAYILLAISDDPSRKGSPALEDTNPSAFHFTCCLLGGKRLFKLLLNYTLISRSLEL